MAITEKKTVPPDFLFTFLNTILCFSAFSVVIEPKKKKKEISQN